ncbi:MAG: N-acetylmuramoyl-L-alanine amidase [Prevotella sp.]|nr:N-acetylmuramoyl-L-alanine amidase [Prevotella sp.]
MMCMVAMVALAQQNTRKFTLVIDAGHGGHDSGALGSYSKEKNINLNVALAFGRYVEQNCPDVKVIYTRKRDVFVTLHERANIANRNKADLFVSIHTNALPRGRQARGLETYTLGMHRAGDNLDVAKRENSVILIEKDYKQHYEGFDPNSSESYILFEFMQDKNMANSVELAKFVQRKVCAQAGRPNKGVKQAGFLVLRETSMPSCLIELGFITTPSEEAFLASQDNIEKIGKGIYEAFVEYRKKFDKSFTVPFKPADEEERNVEHEERQRVKPTEPDTLSNPVAPEEKKHERVPQEEKPVKNQNNDAPVFKVQILTMSKKLSAGNNAFKGLTDVDCYQDNGSYKYTVGASTDYNEIYRLRKSILNKFPEAFIIAFKNGQRTDVVAAIREFKQNRK